MWLDIFYNARAVWRSRKGIDNSFGAANLLTPGMYFGGGYLVFFGQIWNILNMFKSPVILVFTSKRIKEGAILLFSYDNTSIDEQINKLS